MAGRNNILALFVKGTFNMCPVYGLARLCPYSESNALVQKHQCNCQCSLVVSFSEQGKLAKRFPTRPMFATSSCLHVIPCFAKCNSMLLFNCKCFGFAKHPISLLNTALQAFFTRWILGMRPAWVVAIVIVLSIWGFPMISHSLDQRRIPSAVARNLHRAFW